MTIRVQWFVWCDGCGGWFSKYQSRPSESRAKQLRAAAASSGWQVRRRADGGQVDLCEVCTAEHDADKKRGLSAKLFDFRKTVRAAKGSKKKNGRSR